MTWVRTDHIPNEQPHDPLEASPPFPEHQTLWQNSDLRTRVGQTREQPSPAQLLGTTPNAVQMRNLRFRMARHPAALWGVGTPHSLTAHHTPTRPRVALSSPEKQWQILRFPWRVAGGQPLLPRHWGLGWGQSVQTPHRQCGLLALCPSGSSKALIRAGRTRLSQARV